MNKLLMKFCNVIKSIKIPWRLKSKLHDNFHCTGDQLYNRKISELCLKGANRVEIIENLFGKPISEISTKDLKALEVFFDKRIATLNQQDRAFDYVIPSLFSQKYYRGVFESNTGLKSLKKGDIYTDCGYSWFTPQKSYAEDFSECGGVLIETVIPAGTKISRDIFFDGLGVTGLNPFSSMNIVVQRNTRYKVLENTLKNNKTYIRLKRLGI